MPLAFGVLVLDQGRKQPQDKGLLLNESAPLISGLGSVMPTDNKNRLGCVSMIKPDLRRLVLAHLRLVLSWV